MIKVEHLSKSFGDLKVLDDVSIDYRPGICNMVIGASGSGKTVFLKTLIGLIQPDAGSVSYNGKDLMAMGFREKTRFRQKIGVLFQNSALFDFATVLENVMFPMDFFTDWSRSEKKDKAEYCLERVNVKDAENKYPNELSGGMQKRVGIARAIALDPAYLFCDEPNSGLDPYTSILIDQLVSELTKELGMTTVINTHDMNSILEIGDNIGFLYGGKMIWKGDRHSIFHTYGMQGTQAVRLRQFPRTQHNRARRGIQGLISCTKRDIFRRKTQKKVTQAFLRHPLSMPTRQPLSKNAAVLHRIHDYSAFFSSAGVSAGTSGAASTGASAAVSATGAAGA